jgi:hypothetical protein
MPKKVKAIPKIKESVTFKFDWFDGFGIYIDNKFAFARRLNRWTFRRQHYISAPFVASEIFDFYENPTTEEIEAMEITVDAFAGISDAFEQCKSEYLEMRMNQRNIPIPLKSYFSESETDNEIGDNCFRDDKYYVYLISHKNGLTKIGRSKNPSIREKTLQAEDPMLKMIFTIEAELHIESRLHDIFCDKRVRGEWFDLDERSIDWIIFFLSKGQVLYSKTIESEGQITNGKTQKLSAVS